MNNEYISACARTDPGCLVNVPLELSNIVPPALILGSQVQIKNLVHISDILTGIFSFEPSPPFFLKSLILPDVGLGKKMIFRRRQIHFCVKSNKNLTFDVPFFIEMGK